MSEQTRYTRIDHTGDLGIRVPGGDLESIFRNAAVALFELLANRGSVRPLETREITAEGTETETLLVDWLNEFLYVFNGQGFAFHDCSVEILAAGGGKERVVGRGRGEPLDRTRHDPGQEIKSATYHQLYVKKRPDDTYEAQVIFDV